MTPDDSTPSSIRLRPERPRRSIGRVPRWLATANVVIICLATVLLVVGWYFYRNTL